MEGIQVKRGNAANLGNVVPKVGEPVWAKDTKKLYVGDEEGNLVPINPDLPNFGDAAMKATGTAVGDVVVVMGNGKIDPSLLPLEALSEPFVVANEVEMLALTAQTGDVAIRADLGKNYILKQAPASVVENWIEFLNPPPATVIDGGTF